MPCIYLFLMTSRPLKDSGQTVNILLVFMCGDWNKESDLLFLDRNLVFKEIEWTLF